MTTGRARRWAKEAALIIGSSAVSTIAFFRVGLVSFSTPIDYAGDAVSEAAFARIIIETGWNAHSNRLGAPTGLTAYDFPLGADNLHNFIIKMMSWFIRDPVALVNAYFLLGFVLVAIVTYAVLRSLRVSVPFALGASLLYSFAPYHMIRGTAHITLGAYFSVPLICWIVLRLYHGDPVFVAVGPGRRVRLQPGVIVAVVAVAVVGSSGAYYALMSVPLAAVAALVGAWRADRGRRLSIAIGACAFTGLTMFTVALNNLPTVLYRHANGSNPAVAVRYPWEVDDYALRPIDLVTPVPGHHISALRSLSATLSRNRSVTERSQFLGLVTAFGLVLAVAMVLARGVARPRDPLAEQGPWRGPPEPQASGLLIIVSILIGVVGGLSWIAAIVGVTDVRAWNRISIVIAFFSLVALVVVGERLLERRTWPPLARPALVFVVVTVGLFDQTGGLRSDPRTTAAAYRADGAFVHQIETTLPTSSMVFQLPWQAFPEQPPLGTMSQYDQLKLFIQSHTIRWSYAGMRGRASDWQEVAVASPPPQLLDDIAAVGFAGLVIDRSGYNPTDADQLVASVASATGSGPAFSGGAGGHLVFFDLRAARAALIARLGQSAVDSLAATTLDVPTTWWSGGFWLEERSGGHVFHNSRRDGTTTVFNRAPATWHGTLSMKLRAFAPGAHQVDVTIGGTTTPFAVTDQWIDVQIPLTLAPGSTALHFHSDSAAVQNLGDARTLVFAIQDPEFRPA